MDKEDTLSFIRSLLVSSKNSYELNQLLRDFKTENGYQMPLFGYKTHLDFLESIPDIVKVERLQQTIFIKPVLCQKSAHISSLVRRQKNSPNINFKRDSFGNHCHSEASCNNNNVSNRTIFKELGNNMNKRQLNINKKKNLKVHNAENDEAECDKTSRNLLSNSGSKCVPSTLPVKSSNTNFEQYVSLVSRKGIEVSIPRYTPLGDIILNLNKIPKLQLSSYTKVGEYVEVCVPEVCNPHKFFLQLRQYKIKLFEFMSELQSFYSANKEKYMCNELLQPNQLCAVLYKTNSYCLEWYRAIIIKQVNELTAIVFLIDYGTITKIQFSKIRFLHHLFGSFPVQAFQGHLANIKCIGNEWSLKSRERFYSMVFERDLIAGVVGLNDEESWLSVALSYTYETDVHINDTLVDENLAIFDCNNTTNASTPTLLDYSTLHLDLMSWLLPSDVDRIRSPRSQLPSIGSSTPGKDSMKTERSRRSSRSEPSICDDPVSYSDKNERLLQMFLAYEKCVETPS